MEAIHSQTNEIYGKKNMLYEYSPEEAGIYKSAYMQKDL
jgi:hypothetical protein